MASQAHPYVYMEELETPSDTRAQPNQMWNTAMAGTSMGKLEQGILGSGGQRNNASRSEQ
jgi:hypothetical protein